MTQKPTKSEKRLIDKINQQHSGSKKAIENHPDTGMIVLAAVRYAMGRRTYAVSTIIDWTKQFWDVLHQNDKNNIARDVKEFIESDLDKGDDCDRKDWENFNNWIINKNTNQI